MQSLKQSTKFLELLKHIGSDGKGEDKVRRSNRESKTTETYSPSVAKRQAPKVVQPPKTSARQLKGRKATLSSGSGRERNGQAKSVTPKRTVDKRTVSVERKSRREGVSSSTRRALSLSNRLNYQPNETSLRKLRRQAEEESPATRSCQRKGFNTSTPRSRPRANKSAVEEHFPVSPARRSHNREPNPKVEPPIRESRVVENSIYSPKRPSAYSRTSTRQIDDERHNVDHNFAVPSLPGRSAFTRVLPPRRQAFNVSTHSRDQRLVNRNASIYDLNGSQRRDELRVRQIDAASVESHGLEGLDNSIGPSASQLCSPWDRRNQYPELTVKTPFVRLHDAMKSREEPRGIRPLPTLDADGFVRPLTPPHHDELVNEQYNVFVDTLSRFLNSTDYKPVEIAYHIHDLRNRLLVKAQKIVQNESRALSVLQSSIGDRRSTAMASGSTSDQFVRNWVQNAALPHDPQSYQHNYNRNTECLNVPAPKRRRVVDQNIDPRLEGWPQREQQLSPVVMDQTKNSSILMRKRLPGRRALVVRHLEND